MTEIQITKDEKKLLQNYSKTTPLILIRLKTQAILFASNSVSVDIISDVVDRTAATIEKWLVDWVNRRIASIFTGHQDNQNAAILTQKQKNQVKLALEKPPSEYNLPVEFWDVSTLKEYTQTEFGTVYETDESYHFLLKFCNYSFKYPDKQSPNRATDQEITERTEEIRKEIATIKENYPDTIVFSADETRFQYESEIRKAWLQKGKKTVVKTQRSDKHQNYFGFLDNDSGKCSLFEIEKGNQDETIRVLKELKKTYPTQNLCIVWDNAAWHKSKLLRQELSTNGELANIHLINFAPYSPETNPIEHVWKWSKGKISNRSSTEWGDLKNEFEGYVNSREFDYKI
jgi:transposase